MFVLATQNPIEMEGTYPLPEAQLDRFLMKLMVEMPTREQLSEIISRTTGSKTASAGRVMDGEELLTWQATVADVVAAPHVLDYAARLVLATHPGQSEAPDSVNQHVRHGASPRAAQALARAGKFFALLDGRLNLSFRDIKLAARPVFRHRVLLTYQAQADNVTPDSLTEQILTHVPETAAA
jgi:MoxR-like ATPase